MIEIPVCYDKEFAPDLSYVANYCGLTEAQIVSLHSEPEYLVHMLGFLPGFLYLGGLNQQLYCPRKTTPAKAISTGSVAIGGQQTGIYPISSPGGWQIIGRTPLKLFNPDNSEPAIASPLDKIKFVPIIKQVFKQIEKLQNTKDSLDIKHYSGLKSAQMNFVKAGLQTSIQDSGCIGQMHLGIAHSDAMDPDSMKMANWLVGKPLDSAVILE